MCFLYVVELTGFGEKVAWVGAVLLLPAFFCCHRVLTDLLWELALEMVVCLMMVAGNGSH